MKKKCYVITVSEKFPATHSRRGQETKFIEKIRKGLKKHTIRSNYWFWFKRITEINKGNAYLSIRIWSGKPYASKQTEIMKLTNVGIEKLDKSDFGFKINSLGVHFNERDFALNDGLLVVDFKEWFKKAVYPMAIIHFTDFRYINNHG